MHAGAELDLRAMTPADLASTVRHITLDVLRGRDLETSVVPEEVTVERPRNPDHGDYATNIALQVAKKVGMNPRDLGEALSAVLADHPAIDSAEVAGPGFINLRLASAAQGQLVADILKALSLIHI